MSTSKEELQAQVERLISARKIARKNASRAVRILEAIGEGAEARGIQESVKHGYLRHGSLTFAVKNRIYELYIREAIVGGTLSDLLEVRLNGPGIAGYDGRRWRDKVRTRLETVVPEMVAAIGEAQPGQDESDRKKAEADALWEVQRERDHERREADHNESVREAALLGSLDRWKRARELRELLKVLRGRPAGLDGDAQRAANEWLTWAESYIEKVDPVNDRLAMPGWQTVSRRY